MNGAGVISAPYRTRIWNSVSTSAPSLPEAFLIIGSALLTILAFPNFDLWFLAWIGLVPLLLVVVAVPTARRAFVAGWLWGTIFFYGSCWWLTYPMIHYAHIRAWLAYPLFLLPIILVASFPALSCGLLSRIVRQFGPSAIIVAPLIWISVEWLRYVVTGQLWNTLGYSQAFHPWFIQSARAGGVYAVTFLLLALNVGFAQMLLRRFRLAIATLAATMIFGLILSSGSHSPPPIKASAHIDAVVLAIQPNVPMDVSGNGQQMNDLLDRHLSLTRKALQELQASYADSVSSPPRLVVWPESPMNFSYSRDPRLRKVAEDLARANRTSILLNSLEPAANSGEQNSAVMVNEEGKIVARYDKIRLMPFGEYVPLPQWLPGASSVRGIVGEFTPGSSYTLMPLGAIRAGVFICIEAAHPSIARTFTHEGADVLINISNDGYLGPTPVMRQHLSNAIFRAVENDRPLVRVTNTGISAFVTSNGSVVEETSGFQEAVRTWTISKESNGPTFYSRHGDLFVYGCSLISLGIISASFMSRRFGSEARP
jgi:apolipoprotein N-acyltransferase